MSWGFLALVVMPAHCNAAAGGAVSLHDTMVQLEQARLSFQLAIQVRARVLEAYQEIMRMQV